MKVSSHHNMLGAGFLLVVLMALFHIVSTLGYPYPVEYGEGVTLQWATRAAEGGDLYPAIRPERLPWLHNPYPPGGPAVLAALDRVLPSPHPFFAGRIMAVAGLLAACAALFTWLRPRAGTGVAAGAAVLFGVTPAALRYGVMVRVDTLALGCALWAFVLTDRAKRPAHFLIPAALATAAVWVKPTYAAAGLVLLIVLARRKDPRAVGAAIAGGLLTTALMMAHPSLRAATDPLHHLATLQALPWNPAHLFHLLARWSGVHLLVLALGISALTSTADELRSYALAASIPVALTLGIAGSDDHYFLECTAILCMAAATALPPLIKRSPLTVTLLILLQLALLVPPRTPPVFTRTYGQEADASAGGGRTPNSFDRFLSRQLAAELTAREGSRILHQPRIAPGHRTRTHRTTLSIRTPHATRRVARHRAATRPRRKNLPTPPAQRQRRNRLRPLSTRSPASPPPRPLPPPPRHRPLASLPTRHILTRPTTVPTHAGLGTRIFTNRIPGVPPACRAGEYHLWLPVPASPL